MKTKNYEKEDLITFITIVFVVLEIVGIFILSRRKEPNYYKLSGIVSNNNVVTVIADKKERKLLESNQIIYLNDKKEKYKIKENRGVLLKKNNKKYYEILIDVKLPKKIKSTDIVNLSVMKNKENVLEILKNVWKGG